MNASSALSDFEQVIRNNGYRLVELNPDRGIALMLEFYRDHRVDDCPSDSDADMLLYQWGTNDWGNGEWFEVDITRQFIINGEAEDENIWQLSLTFKFPPSAQLRALGPGDKWCPDPRPRGVNYFESFIRASDAFQAILDQHPAVVELDYFCAG
jgi:hypothetical protein